LQILISAKERILFYSPHPKMSFASAKAIYYLLAKRSVKNEKFSTLSGASAIKVYIRSSRPVIIMLLASRAEILENKSFSFHAARQQRFS
jgi:hypothetical protein